MASASLDLQDESPGKVGRRVFTMKSTSQGYRSDQLKLMLPTAAVHLYTVPSIYTAPPSPHHRPPEKPVGKTRGAPYPAPHGAIRTPGYATCPGAVGRCFRRFHSRLASSRVSSASSRGQRTRGASVRCERPPKGWRWAAVVRIWGPELGGQGWRNNETIRDPAGGDGRNGLGTNVSWMTKVYNDVSRMLNR